MLGGKTVSILIPCFNHEKFVEKAIYSALEQENIDFEILISDDCSTDGSKEIISRIKDPRIQTFFFQENHGVVYALNYLMRKSCGKYIAFLGSDDAFKKEKLQKQVEILERNPNVGAVFTHVEVIDQDGCPYEDDEMINHELFQNKNETRAQWMRLFFEKGNQFCHSSALIRRSVYEQIGEYQQIFRQLHDFDYWIRVLRQWDVYVLQEKLTQYRRVKTNNKSISAELDENTIRLYNEYAMIFSEMFRWMPENLLREGFKDFFDRPLEMQTERARYEILTHLRIAGNKVPMASFIYLYSIYDRSGRKSIFSDAELNESIYLNTGQKAMNYGFGIKKELKEIMVRIGKRMRGGRNNGGKYTNG